MRTSQHNHDVNIHHGYTRSEVYLVMNGYERMIAQQSKEIAQLRETCAKEQELGLLWMRRHDALLGWIQRRPVILKELIEDKRAAPNSLLYVHE